MSYLLLDQETERLRFRPVEKDDFHLWLPFFEDPKMLAYIGLDAKLSKQELCEIWFTKVFSRYQENLGGMNAIILKSSGQLIGQCGLLFQFLKGIKRLEVSYHLLPNYTGYGYATEAAVKCKEFAFEFFFAKQLISIIHLENLPSEKVALNNGMHLETICEYQGMRAKIYTLKK